MGKTKHMTKNLHMSHRHDWLAFALACQLCTMIPIAGAFPATRLGPP